MKPTPSIFLGVFLFFLTNSAHATHLFGGYITAKKIRAWKRSQAVQGIYSFTLQSAEGFIHRGKLILE
ncbi:MAG: hypothetical protein V4658_14245 [Bacteroidota bacterium]